MSNDTTNTGYEDDQEDVILPEKKRSAVGTYFSDKKNRNVMIVTSLLIVGIVGIAVSRMSSKPVALPADVTGASVAQGGGGSMARGSVEKEELSPRYNQMMRKDNENRAQHAESGGGSAMARTEDKLFPQERPSVPVAAAAPQAAPPPQQSQAQTAAAQQVAQATGVSIGALLDKWKPGAHADINIRDYSEIARAEQAKMVAAASASGNANSMNSSNMTFNQMSAMMGKTPLVRAGEIAAATIDVSLNSDQLGPVKATIRTGPFAGAMLIGNSVANRTKVSGDTAGIEVTFTKMSLPGKPAMSISARALEANELNNTIATRVDKKYFERFVMRPLSYFIKGLGEAAGRTGGTIVAGTTITSTQESMSDSDRMKYAAGTAAGEIAKDFDGHNTQPTAFVDRSEVIGILFLDDVYDQSGLTPDMQAALSKQLSAVDQSRSGAVQQAPSVVNPIRPQTQQQSSAGVTANTDLNSAILRTYGTPGFQ